MTAPIHVRRAVPGDAEALALVHVRVWRWAYRGLMPDSFLDSLSVERRTARWQVDLSADWLTTWVAEVRGAIVGFAGAAAATRDEDLPPGTAELVMINVLEEHAGRGVGRALLGAVEEHWLERGADLAVLWVLAGNDRARAAYDGLGWVPDGATGDYEVGGITIQQLRLRKHLG
jgi:GNAT superfamily N-acetyltransferase